ncbi:Homeobox and leucine zipper protein Homez Homeodomain leucine zipper-containing factor [Triplophysa tibetana]|uniref:Homeobox and leucine zipper protein Homez Homeodomain leucine zipper-containing factor n=1 Tax=Triplophysa tibetana TaxID=1572043 RepID=A0A5A9PQ83_9TELE|nr:Homeobox and leucine zipper protein Homez Homeodomain leucine zipper-containing factor [Triplophysa tibetana]
MERCAAPRPESTSPPDPVTSSESAAETGADADVYECRICGYKVTNVKCLSQHLQAAHPVTSLPDTSSLGNKRCETQEECEGDVGDDGETSSLNAGLASHVEEKPVTPEGSKSPSPHSPEESSSTVTHEQEERMEVLPVPKATQSSSLVLSQEKSRCSSGPKHACDKRQTVPCGSSIHNPTNLVCLPLVSEGLKLIWVRSEQIQQLDEVSDLVEAFNAFPYPTSQEASALARKCALPPDRVKTWFMMQRVRYGISWGEDDIQETRRKLCHIQKGTEPEECEEVNDEEQERRSLDEMQQVFKQPPVAAARIEQREHTPRPNHIFPQHIVSDQCRFDVSQNNIDSQCNNHGQQLLSSNLVFSNGLEPLSQALQMNSHLHIESKNLHPHNIGVPVFDAYGQSPNMIMNDQYTAAHYHSGPNPLPQSFQSFSGKKSKAQLMALRRSFVRKSWPSDAEVQQLQRTTGLSCREIRKWFADSRYQLRRNGRAWLAKLAKHNRSLQQAQQQDSLGQLDNDTLPSGSLYSNNEVDNTETQFEVDVDDNEGAVNQSNESRQEISDEGELDDNKSSIQQYSADRSTSPPPLSFARGRVEPSVRLRKKTREQLETLRQNFLCCQWPTNDDYLILQQKTGLTKTEIIQWYGDTRYHVKHNQMRWMTSQERERIIAAVTQQQKRSGKYSRGRLLLEGMGSGLGLGDSAFVNGTSSDKPTSWNVLFSGSTPVLPEGEL